MRPADRRTANFVSLTEPAVNIAFVQRTRGFFTGRLCLLRSPADDATQLLVSHALLPAAPLPHAVRSSC